MELKEHVRRNHQKDQVCQTQPIQTEVFPDIEEKPVEENFTPPYPCFYCGKLINSASDLVTHKTNDCQTSLEEYQDTCDHCSLEFKERSDLIKHYKGSHPELAIVWCDFCQAGYGELSELQTHIRLEHREYLPNSF